MAHPVQALAATATHLITASHGTLASFDAATNAPVATNSTAHKALIRLLAVYTPAGEGKESVLVSTGEDKLLVVSSLPDLKTLSARELPKRANALEITQDGEIVVGDKFGDVYLYPLDYTPPPAGTKPEDVPKPQPILGHVSMLNTLALIPAAPEHGLHKDWIATGDRDEHVRFSRFPMGHVIEKFGWGSKSFVSSLLYLPPTPSSPPFLLSGGADPSLQLFSLPSASLAAQFPIEELLMPYIAVAPETPVPVAPGRKKDKTVPGGKKGKGKARQAASEGVEGVTEGETAAGETPQLEEPAEEEEEVDPRGGRELTKGLAVIKMLEVGTTREDGGVIVLAAGSTALLYIPFSLLLPRAADAPAPAVPAVPSLLPFAHPILDFTPVPFPTASTSACEFLVSLDATRAAAAHPSAPSSVHAAPHPTPSDEPAPLARVQLTKAEGHLRALPTLTSDAVLLSSAQAPLKAGTKLSSASLYPVLSLLHHPGDEELAEGPVERTAGDGKPKGGKAVNLSQRGKKRGGETVLSGVDAAAAGEDAGRRVGKRAKGRADTLAKYEEARRKLEQQAKGETGEGVQLTEGERAAVEEIEGEAKRSEEKEGAEIEGAMVA
ncbi:hypothetical protein JCM8097_003484 [Rhodosporidiobolus ruineniae]